MRLSFRPARRRARVRRGAPLVAQSYLAKPQVVGGNPGPGAQLRLPERRRRRRARLLSRRGAAPVHDVPAREEHRDHRARLRQVGRGHEHARRATPASPSRRATSRGRYQTALREVDARRSRRPRSLRGLHDAVARSARVAQVAGRRERRGLQGAHRHSSTPTSRERADAIREHVIVMRAKPRQAGGRGQAAGEGQGRPLTASPLDAPQRDRTGAPRARCADPSSARSSAPAARSRRRLSGFAFRAQQLAMAEAIARRDRHARPADRRGGHRHRQDVRLPRARAARRRQGDRLDRHEDAAGPALRARRADGARRAAACPSTIALLKGRANYVCHHHLERTSREGRLPSREDARHLPKIIAFARASQRGDRGELADVPENASIWPLVTSTRENCLGSQCGFYRDCFVMKARKDALEADVVIVNHHLFFADVMLRDEGLAELLPACNTVILDEAHQLPDTATLFFGEQTTAGQLGDLARDAEVIARTQLKDVPDLPDAASALQPAVRKLRLAAGELPGKFPREAMLAKPAFTEALDALARPSTGSRPRSARSPSAARTSRTSPTAPTRSRTGSRAGRRRRTRCPTHDVRASLDSLDRRHAATASSCSRRRCRWRRSSAGSSTRPRAHGSSRRRRSPSARDFSHYAECARARRRVARAAGTARSTTRRRRCCACRRTCRSRTRSRTPTRSSTPRCR